MDGLSDFPLKTSERVFSLPIRVKKLFKKIIILDVQILKVDVF